MTFHTVKIPVAITWVTRLKRSSTQTLPYCPLPNHLISFGASGQMWFSLFYRHRAQSSESIGRVTMCVACLQCGVRWSPALSGSSFKMRIDFERD